MNRGERLIFHNAEQGLPVTLSSSGLARNLSQCVHLYFLTGSGLANSEHHWRRVLLVRTCTIYRSDPAITEACQLDVTKCIFPSTALLDEHNAPEKKTSFSASQHYRHITCTQIIKHPGTILWHSQPPPTPKYSGDHVSTSSTSS
ncbi:hypothetical protein CY34DRAFT_18403 [Suillus luteus UH-Slu-Lm8-n1]|uniref:Uncharacterized protein n=1 Tax=Suillus luteus UH-Slu-Lm8-n1 TaxID=930992 RepID=A0A0D0A599_9AGAM|nr:hypothetical protein CY34DRAFT_18403 [Suillus luteus UH-Slu-Lm8-n1]